MTPKPAGSSPRAQRCALAQNWVAVSVVSAVFLFAPPCLAEELQMTFEDTSPGQLPSGWTVAATHAGWVLATWTVEAAATPHGGRHVLSLTEPGAQSLVQRVVGSDTYNLCWTSAPRFADVDLEVALRGNAGRLDQGGGPIWRAQDANNYYVARYNPLERNLRVYFVKDGNRVQLASAEGLAVRTGEWFAIRIVHRGTSIQAYLNGVRLIEVDDRTLTAAGGVGVWTKADAATSFDDFRVRGL